MKKATFRKEVFDDSLNYEDPTIKKRTDRPGKDYDPFSEEIYEDSRDSDFYEELSDFAEKRKTAKNRLWDEMDHSERNQHEF